MADEDIIPELLVEQLVAAAAEVTPIEASAFREIALDNLAALREQVVEEKDEGPLRDQISLPGRFVVAERYSKRLGLYLVFDAFVGVFVRPVELSLSNLRILRQLEVDKSPTAIAFARFGENQSQVQMIGLEQEGQLQEASGELRDLATAIGRDLFGADFRPSDFWGADAGTIEV